VTNDLVKVDLANSVLSMSQISKKANKHRPEMYLTPEKLLLPVRGNDLVAYRARGEVVLLVKTAVSRGEGWWEGEFWW